MSNIIEFPTNDEYLFQRGLELIAEGKVKDGLSSLDEAFVATEDEELHSQTIFLFVETCLEYNLSQQIKSFWKKHFPNKEELLSREEYLIPYMLSLPLVVQPGHETISELYLLKDYAQNPTLLSQIDFLIEQERQLVHLVNEADTITTPKEMVDFLDKNYNQSIENATQLLRMGDHLTSFKAKELFYLELLKNDRVSPFIKQMALTSSIKLPEFIQNHPVIEYEWFGDLKTVHLNNLLPMREDPIFLEGIKIMSHYFDENDPHLALETFELYEHCYSFIYPFADEIIGHDIAEFVQLLISPQDMMSSSFMPLMELIEVEMFLLFESSHTPDQR